MGIVSALGVGVENNRSALVGEKSGLGYSRFLRSKLIDKLPVGEVPFSNDQLWAQASMTIPRPNSRQVLLAIPAIQEALGGNTRSALPGRTGFINATSVGGMADVENIYTDLINPAAAVEDLALGDALDCAQGTETLAGIFGIKDQIATISTACSSSANAIMYGARLIRNGLLDNVLCGGTDTLTRFTLNGFNSLKNVDPSFCKPFDEHRNGLNLGEGSAYILLEGERSLAISGRIPLAELKGYCNYNEAFHPTAPSPEGEGAFQAMRGAIKMAGLELTDLSYINAHGTATSNNDIAEAIALNRLFGDSLPAFSSTKGYTGHTLAAAGAIEAVFAILSLQFDELYPTLNFSTPIAAAPLVPITKVQRGITVKNILSNSFGFGGNNASLLLGKYG